MYKAQAAGKCFSISEVFSMQIVDIKSSTGQYK